MARKRSSSRSKGSQSSQRRPARQSAKAGSSGNAVIELHTTDDEQSDLEMEAVEPPPQAATQEDDDLDLEDVDVPASPDANGHAAEYAGVHHDQEEPTAAESDAAEQPIYHDGKGQSGASTGISLTFDDAQTPASSTAGTPRRQRTNLITPRDRAARLEGHKLHVLALLAHCKARNAWINDEPLRDHLYNMTPAPLRQKLRSIHPKKVESQRERVRMFEAFLSDLVRWWATRFYLDPDMSAAGAIRQPNADMLSGAFPRPGRRVDGWLMETDEERTKRHTMRNRNGRKGKQATKALGRPSQVAEEITIFPPGSDPMSRPAYLRLLPTPEPLRSPSDLLASAKSRAGSRETSAQLFCALCRSLGIPARLVISPQVAAWSIGASKVAQSAGAITAEDRKAAKGKGGKGKAVRSLRKAAVPGSNDVTSEEDSFVEGLSIQRPESVTSVQSTSSRRSRATAKKAGTPGTASRPMSVESRDTSPTELAGARNGRSKASGKQPPSKRKAGARGAQSAETGGQPGIEEAGTASKSKKQGKAKKDGDEDYRDEKWKGLQAPLDVTYEPKLRQSKPVTKETALESQKFEDIDPVDLTSPPVMWVEVFSKPYQRWITVDPIRARVIATGNRHMEPSTSDRANKLVYVMAFEEDGYARDVTARYSKTLYSRISRMRPPATRKDGDWWEAIVQAMHRPQRLERDAVEDAELEEAASKEPMPNSVGGFKDHPVYALERHLKRDEAIHPYNQIGTFQGMPVFNRKNVLSLRSARQWYNEGREVAEGQQALKWVKTRGYTINSRRAEEQARAEGAEEPQEGLYARFQTQLYVPPPVEDGIVPKNHFGNIDLFVPTMLPEGAAHIPYNGTAKVAKKLGVNFAEAITGFEFRKHRSMPKLTGIVVPEEHEEAVLDAYWASQQAAAEKEINRQQERALRHWRKLLNALRIAKRMKEQYGSREEGEEGQGDVNEQGGFVEEDHAPGITAEGAPSRPSPTPPPEKSRMTRKLEKYGTVRGVQPEAQPQDSEDEEETQRHEPQIVVPVTQDVAMHEAEAFSDATSRNQLVERGAIISLSALANQGRPSAQSSNESPTLENGSKRRRIVIKKEAAPETAAHVKVPTPAPTSSPSLRHKRSSRLKTDDVQVESSDKVPQGTRRSTRRAAAARRSLAEPTSSGDEEELT
ncbi:unnamed protein product [Parajaminaea phylloscopi]